VKVYWTHTALNDRSMRILSSPLLLTDRIPTQDECDALMVAHTMLPNIVAHSIQVMLVAVAIADNLKAGVSVDRDLVMAAALLHDITKTRSLQTKERHSESGGEFLRGLGFASTAEIVRQHVILTDFRPEGPLEEREIVNYADKRVMHDRIVSLEERVKDLLRRYGTTEEIRQRIRHAECQVRAVEKKIRCCMAVDLDTALANMS
jgi:uncharacterized protein